MFSKFHFVVIASVLGLMVWIEQGHRSRIGAPTDAEIATSRARAAGCPDNDNLPYSSSCIAFLEGGAISAPRWQIDRAQGAPAAFVDMPN